MTTEQEISKFVCIEYHITQINTFVSFLKKFSKMGNSFVLEFDKHHLRAVCSSREKSGLKQSIIPISEILKLELCDMSFDKPIKIAINDLKKVLDGFDHLKDPTTMKLEVRESSNYYNTVRLSFRSGSLTLTYRCGRVDMIEKDIYGIDIEEILKPIDLLFSFECGKADLHKLIRLSNKLLTNNDSVRIESDKFSVNFTCDNFTHSFAVGNHDNEGVLDIRQNDFVNFVDEENVVFYVCQDKLICSSVDSNTQIAIGREVRHNTINN